MMIPDTPTKTPLGNAWASNPMSMSGPNGHLSFPLTPALSLGERENRRQSVDESDALGNYTRRASLFPLPEGEGQGEGEQNRVTPWLRTTRRPVIHLESSCRAGVFPTNASFG